VAGAAASNARPSACICCRTATRSLQRRNDLWRQRMNIQSLIPGRIHSGARTSVRFALDRKKTLESRASSDTPMVKRRERRAPMRRALLFAGAMLWVSASYQSVMGIRIKVYSTPVSRPLSFSDDRGLRPSCSQPRCLKMECKTFAVDVIPLAARRLVWVAGLHVPSVVSMFRDYRRTIQCCADC